jgi:hypothetical protein
MIGTQHPPERTQSASITLERAMTAKMIESEPLLMQFGPSLDPAMFLESNNSTAITVSRELVEEGVLTRRNLEYRLEKNGVKDAKSFVETLYSAATPSSEFKKHLHDWVDDATARYIKRSESALAEERCTTPELIARKTEILDTATKLGKVDDGLDFDGGIEAGKAWLSELRSAMADSCIAKTGFKPIDNDIIGLLPGTLTTIAARPATGKTTLALRIAHRVMCEGGKVLFNTLEMAAGRLSIKLAALIHRDSSMAYERSFEATDVGYYNGVIDKLDSAKRDGIRFLAKHDIWSLESAIMAARPSLVVFDYLQLMHTPREFSGRRHEFIGDVARRLQQVAVKHNVPVLVLAQLNREADGKEAGLANIKDSSGIEEASDNVLFLSNPSPNFDGIDALRRELTVKKARSGRAGAAVQLMLNPLTGALEEWDTVSATVFWNKSQNADGMTQSYFSNTQNPSA